MRKTDRAIACLGDLMFEEMVRAHRLPAKNETLIYEQSEDVRLGGPAFNVAWYLRQLGDPVYLVGAYGSFDAPRVMKQVRAARIDTSSLIPVRGRTDTLFATISAGHHQSWYMRSVLPESIGNRFLAHARAARVLVLTGSRHATIRRAYRRLLRMGNEKTVIFNPSYAISEFSNEELRSFCARADVTVVNEEESEYLRKVFNVSRMNDLVAKVPGSLVITRGRLGQLIATGKRVWKVAGIPVQAINTIGAGDGFLAGLVHKLVNGQPLLEAAKFGSALASLVVASGDVRARISEQRVRRTMRVASQAGA
jgi:sugar/nucleoside kinase (ribokinase family)